MSLRSIYEEIDPATIDKWDHYIDIYAKRLAGGQQRPLKILEIGVQGGGSLKMWRRYFGDQAKIIGLDIDERCRKLATEGFEIVIGSQADEALLDHLIAQYGPFDVVIDDGSHVGSDQITSFKKLIPHTRYLYFVEDTHTSYWGRWQPLSQGFIPFAKGLIDDLHMYFVLANSPEVYGKKEWEKIAAGHDLGIRSRVRSISFFDSMVVFELGLIGAPLRHRRGAPPAQPDDRDGQ